MNSMLILPVYVCVLYIIVMRIYIYPYTVCSTSCPRHWEQNLYSDIAAIKLVSFQLPVYRFEVTSFKFNLDSYLSNTKVSIYTGIHYMVCACSILN